jgi:hypothetical protein
MDDELRILFEIDRITSVDELILIRRGLNSDGDMTPKLEQLIEARLAYLGVWDEVRS